MTDIKPDLPWSIKGVTADARARAKAAAKRDGLTMGAWLSQAIESGAGAPPAADVVADGVVGGTLVARWGRAAPRRVGDLIRLDHW